MPKGYYKRTEYHNAISRKNGFQKGYSSHFKGKKLSEERIEKIKEMMKNPERIKISIANLPQNIEKENNGNWKGGKPKCVDCGKQLENRKAKRCCYCNNNLPKVKEKLRLSHLGQKAWNSGKEYKQISGKNHWNYKGGITPENHKIRTSAEYTNLLKMIKERDDYRCFDCGERGGILHSDHILSFAKYPRLRLEPNNIQTLCKSCHKQKTIFERTGKMILNSLITI